MKKGGNHLLIYPAAAVFAVLAVMQALENFLPQIAGFFLYALAAVSLTAACVSLYKDLKRGAIGHLFQIIKGTSLGSHFLEDYTFRTILTTVPTVLINVAYTIYNGVIGIMSQSSWFITMAVYYSLLGAMRYHAVSTGRKISRMEDPAMVRRKELSVIRTDGILLFLLDLALSGVILLTIAKGRAKVYSDIIAISIAAYTFYKITMAVINMVKVRKFQSPILLTIRNIGVADALVSMLTLQMTMLASFRENSSLDADRMNAVTGMVICVLIALLGIRMICYASKRKEAG